MVGRSQELELSELHCTAKFDTLHCHNFDWSYHVYDTNLTGHTQSANYGTNLTGHIQSANNDTNLTGHIQSANYGTNLTGHTLPANYGTNLTGHTLPANYDIVYCNNSDLSYHVYDTSLTGHIL